MEKYGKKQKGKTHNYVKKNEIKNFLIFKMKIMFFLYSFVVVPPSSLFHSF